MFISELHIQGYKRLRDVKLPLRELTVLIGPNASGKTSVLQVLHLLARAAGRDLGDALRDLGGIDRIVSRGAGATDLTVTCSLTTHDGRRAGEYDVCVQGLGGGLHVVAGERLSLPEGQVLFLVSDGAVHTEFPASAHYPTPPDPQQTLLSQVSPANAPEDAHRRSFRDVALFRPFDVGPGAPVWRSQQVRPASVPGPNAEDLLAAVQTLRSRSPDMFETYEAALRAGFPAYQALDLEPVGAGQVALTWRERGQTYYAHELSEGTLRFLWLCAILHSSDPPRMVLIDEPEVSLHPELLKILSGLLDDASHRTQLLVATQSPELVSWLKPEQVVVLDLDEEGWTKATPATDLDLDEWLRRYTLGELWVRGDLGGRP